MQYLDHVQLQAVLDGFQKKAFVPMPGGQQPVAGAGPMTEGMGAPMGDPAMGGMPPEGMPPMDPAMGGMPPEMMGGMPPMDPGMMGPPSGSVTMSVPELLQLIEVVKGTASAAPLAAPGEEPALGMPGEEAKPKRTTNAQILEKLDGLLGMLGGGDPGAGMPPPPMPPEGMPPPGMPPMM